MVFQLLPLVAGAVLRTAGTRVAAGAVARGASGTGGQALNFGGRALQSHAMHQNSAQAQRQQQVQQPGLMDRLSQPGMGAQGAEQFSSMLQQNQFLGLPKM